MSQEEENRSIEKVCAGKMLADIVLTAFKENENLKSIVESKRDGRSSKGSIDIPNNMEDILNELDLYEGANLEELRNRYEEKIEKNKEYNKRIFKKVRQKLHKGKHLEYEKEDYSYPLKFSSHQRKLEHIREQRDRYIKLLEHDPFGIDEDNTNYLRRNIEDFEPTRVKEEEIDVDLTFPKNEDLSLVYATIKNSKKRESICSKMAYNFLKELKEQEYQVKNIGSQDIDIKDFTGIRLVYSAEEPTKESIEEKMNCTLNGCRSIEEMNVLNIKNFYNEQSGGNNCQESNGLRKRGGYRGIGLKTSPNYSLADEYCSNSIHFTDIWTIAEVEFGDKNHNNYKLIRKNELIGDDKMDDWIYNICYNIINTFIPKEKKPED